ncbi:hypothetical protein LUZ60_000713 [Juncus effusus]|nr:hypothetical protein LUZ60_000713 [Juncus effusus]
MAIPKIDFSLLDPTNPTTEQWKSVQFQVSTALSSSGCFEAKFPNPHSPPGFGDAVRDLFKLPLEKKMRNYYGPERPFHGYMGQFPDLDSFESLAIRDAQKIEAVRDFADLLWPDGNPQFCEIVQPVAKHLAELEKMVRRMVLESLGVSQYYESQNESNWYLFRFVEYKPPSEEEERKGGKKLGYYAHQDTNTLSIINQIQTDGLEIQTREGDWISAAPPPNSFLVMAGNVLRAWTNGFVHAPYHRIAVGGKVARYSSILFSVPGENDGLVQVIDELVDNDHPALFKPYDYNEYVRFCAVEKDKVEDKLVAFCGVNV